MNLYAYRPLFSPCAILLLLSYNCYANDDGDWSAGPWPTISGLAATANSAMTAATNPAGMSHFHTEEFIVQTAFIHSRSESSGEITGLNLERSDSESGNLVIPSFYYTRPLNDKWDFGLSVNAPAGFGDDYGDDSLSRYFATEWTLIFLAINPSLSYKVTDNFSIGGTLALNYSNYHIESKVFNVDSPGSNDGDMELKADGISASYQLGLLYQFSEQTRVGLSYRSGTDAELEDKPKFSNLSANTQTMINASGRADRDLSIESELPPILVVGLYHEYDSGISVSADIARINFSDFKLTEFSFIEDKVIARQTKYDDVYAFSLGLSYPYNGRLTLGAGAGYMENPVDADQRSFLFRIDTSWIVGVGGEYKLDNDRSLTLNLNYGQSDKGEINTQGLPVIGEINSEYDKREFFIVDLKYKWR